MCQRVFIASEHKLPLVDWNPEKPSLYIRSLDEAFSKERLNTLFPKLHLYEAGSFMGCGCGFIYGSWTEEDPTEDHDARRRDVILLMEYLKSELLKGSLYLFCTWWEQLKESYQTIDFDLNLMDAQQFDFPEDHILRLTALQA